MERHRCDALLVNALRLISGKSFQIAFTLGCLVNLGRSLIEELELQFGADGPIEINSCCHGVSIVAFYGALSPAESFKNYALHRQDPEEDEDA